LCLGEFGRTPKVNKDAGRDHWPHAMSILAAGAGTPRGYVLGATDAKGYYAADNVHSPEDFAATLYTKMGVDPTEQLITNTGRPGPRLPLARRRAARHHGDRQGRRQVRAAGSTTRLVRLSVDPHHPS